MQSWDNLDMQRSESGSTEQQMVNMDWKHEEKRKTSEEVNVCRGWRIQGHGEMKTDDPA